MINVGLLQEAWAFAQEHPESYRQGWWGMRTAEGEASETHDIAGIALKLLGAAFVWTPVADHMLPVAAQLQAWDCQDVAFSSLPGRVRVAIVEHCTRYTKDIYANYFWHAVASDRCPIGLAARVALGITTADALVLFEEDAEAGEIGGKVQELMARGKKQWEAENARQLGAGLASCGLPVTAAELT